MRRLLMGLVIFGFFGTSAHALTNEDVVKGLTTIATEAPAIKNESCAKLNEADRKACDLAVDNLAAFANSMILTVPVLNNAGQVEGRKALFAELNRRIAIVRPFELLSRQLTQR